MTENRTKIIDLKDNEKDKLSQLKKNKKKPSKVVDTGKNHEVSINISEDDENNLSNLWSEDYKQKYRNPFRRLYSIINEEELNDKTSDALVRFFGIITGIAIIFIAICFITGYYFLYSSYSANYKRGVEAEQRGNYESALKYYSKALDKTDNKDKKIEVLNNLIEISEIQETDLNVKSYLLDLVLTDPTNADAVLKLKSLYLDSGDIESIFNLASEIRSYATSELLYDIILNQPVFDYKSGTYDEEIVLTITSGEGCKIYYTTDGSPAGENSTPYMEPIVISDLGTTTIHAVSINSDGVISEDYAAVYEIISSKVDAPNVFPQSGTYNTDTEIIIDVPSGYTAYYTLDGSEPNINSSVYKKGMIIPYGNHVFTVRFINPNGNESESVSRVYIFEPEYDIALNEAYYLLKEELVKTEVLHESEGVVYTGNGASPVFDCKTIITLNEELYYCVLMSDTYNGESEYAVNVNNGAVFKLKKNESGSYYLDTVK